MPFLRVGHGTEEANIYYRVYGEGPSGSGASNSDSEPSKRSVNGSRADSNGAASTTGRTTNGWQAHEQNGSQDQERPSVVLIMGFAAGHACWGPQLDELLKPVEPGGQAPTRVLVMDNRGVGRSSSPLKRKAYTTDIMAGDVLTLMEHVGWQRAHVVGHSMGAMVAMKLAAAAPQRLASLTIISATGGGWQSVPSTWRAARYAWRALHAKNPRDRAQVDLKFHFMRKTLREMVHQYGVQRGAVLLEEYLSGIDRDSGGPQPKHGMKGQLNAVWKHSLSHKEVQQIKAAGFPMQVIHGRHDIVAQPKWGERLAQVLECPAVFLEGAHFLTRERGADVNGLILALVLPSPQPLLHRDPNLYMDAPPQMPTVPFSEAEVLQEVVPGADGVASSGSQPRGGSDDSLNSSASLVRIHSTARSP